MEVEKPDMQGARIILRGIKDFDVDDLFEIYSCEATMKFASDPVFKSVATVYLMLESVNRLELSGESFEWAIEVKDTGKVIGTCGIHSFCKDGQVCEIGCLLHSNYWRQGYMSESLELIVNYAKSQGIVKLLADIDGENFRSIKLFTKLGFEPQENGQYYLPLNI